MLALLGICLSGIRHAQTWTVSGARWFKKGAGAKSAISEFVRFAKCAVGRHRGRESGSIISSAFGSPIR